MYENYKILCYIYVKTVSPKLAYHLRNVFLSLLRSLEVDYSCDTANFFFFSLPQTQLK